jgi:hypothetical protein
MENITCQARYNLLWIIYYNPALRHLRRERSGIKKYKISSFYFIHYPE